MRWLLIDQILDCEPGISARGAKTFPRSDLIFIDHFPGYPIVPGVLQIEMIAQLGGKCMAFKNPNILPVLGSVKAAKFYHNVNPGDRCIIKIKVIKMAKSYGVVEGEVEVDDKKVSSATILFAMIDRSKISSNEFDAVSEDWKKRQKSKMISTNGELTGEAT